MKEGYKTVIKKITRFELPTIIGFHAVQIMMALLFLLMYLNMVNTLQTAEYEFKKGKTPFIIKKQAMILNTGKLKHLIFSPINHHLYQTHCLYLIN